MKRFPLIVSLLLVAVFSLLITAAAGAATDGASPRMTIQRVDKSRFPIVKLRLGLTTEERTRKFQVKENGRAIKKVDIRSHDTKKPVAVTLLIDISGSMKGKPLEEAQKAARVFVERAGPRDRIAIVAFSTEVNRVADFTSNKAVLNEAIDGLEAAGETAVFDALQEGLEASRKQELSEQSMVVLSDGADTASEASAAAVTELAGKLQIPVSAIVLESPELDEKPLKELAERSGGRLITAVSSEALAGLYDGLAAELHNRYQITFTSQTKKNRADIQVTAEVEGQRLRASTAVTRLKPPVVPRPKKPRPRVNAVSRIGDFALVWMAAILAFAAVFLAILALGDLWRPGRSTLAKQLKYYDQLHGRSPSESGEPFIRKLNKAFVGGVKTVSIKYRFNEYAQKKLEQAGLPMRPHEYIAVHLIAVVGSGLAIVLMGGGTFLTLIVIVVATIGPLLAVDIMIGRRKNSFRDQLPETLDLLAGSLRAGYGLQQAVTAAGREAREPTAVELKRVSSQVQMGMPLEEALNRMNSRIGDDAFKWVVLAISIHKETGGNLAEIFDNLAESLRQRERMRRQIKGLTAEGRLSAYILVILPFAEGLIMFYLNPAYMSLLVTTVPGFVMLGMALLLMTGGALWLKQITNIDY